MDERVSGAGDEWNRLHLGKCLARGPRAVNRLTCYHGLFPTFAAHVYPKPIAVMKLHLMLCSISVGLFTSVRPVAKGAEADFSGAVAQVVSPLMKQWDIPGMAVGVTLD